MKLIEIKKLNEAMEPTEIFADVEKAGKMVEAELSKMFKGNEWRVNAGIWKGLGKSFVIDFSETGYQNGIIQNAKYRVHLMMHLTDGGGNYKPMSSFEFGLLSMSTQLSNAGVAYRKIKGNSPMDAAKKVVAWFKKNEKKIKASASPDRDVLIKKLIICKLFFVR